MAFNTVDGFTPRSFDEIRADYKDFSSSQFPSEDFSDYENGDLFLVHYADMQNTLKLENTLLEIEEKFYTFLEQENNKIRQSKISTRNGLLEALYPFVKNKEVSTYLVEPGVIEIYGNFIDNEANPFNPSNIANVIYESIALGIYTQNELGRTDTDPKPESDELNIVETITDSIGSLVNIYFSKVVELPVYIKIKYTKSNTNLQILSSDSILIDSFLEGLVKPDPLGNPLYSLGKDFEPEKYISPSDHPFVSDFIIEWSETGDSGTFSSAVRPFTKGELLTFSKERFTVEVV